MKCLLLPESLLATAGKFFEDCGTRGFEGTAMIKMGINGPHLVIPDQIPSRGALGGVSVEVTKFGQMQLAREVGMGELYVARIHSHPFEAFHSRTDDENPVLTHEGALSIVVPYFGLGLRLGLDACAVFCHQRNQWNELPAGNDRNRWIQTTNDLGKELA